MSASSHRLDLCLARDDFKIPLAVGAYLVALGGIRLVEVAPVARGYVVDGFPEWMLLYLALLAGMLLLAGASLVLGGIGLRQSVAWSGYAILFGASAYLAATVTHAAFLVLYERAFADGGLLWGVVHLLTLTRLPTTGTEAGIAGYKLGLGAGIACWLGLGVMSLRIGIAARRRGDSQSPGPARAPETAA